MSLQFILGGSGSGKSDKLYKQITAMAQREPNRNFLVVVPEQFTLSTQQKLVALSPGKAIMNVDVLSFKRLAFRVFDDLGMSNIPVLDEDGKNLVLRRLAQEKDEELTILKNRMDRFGYIDEIKSLISEFIQYNVTPECLLEVKEANHFAGSFSRKLDDVVVLYKAFMDYMKDHYITAEEILNVLKDEVKNASLLKGAVIAFDEFTGFTPIQYELLEELLRYVDTMYVALTIDLREKDTPFQNGEGLFDMSKETIKRLMQKADFAGTQVLEPICLDGKAKRFEDREDLCFLEQSLFRINKVYSKEPENISLYSMTNPREELFYTAQKIEQLVRDEGYRYREIAVISGSDVYGTLATSIFDKFHIPYFLDTTMEVRFSPFIEFLRAALEIVQFDFKYDAIMRYLRAGYLPLSDEEIDTLDNYLISTGIKHKSTWKKVWLGRQGKSKQFDLVAIEEIRIKIMDSLRPLIEVVEKKSATIADGILAIYQMLTQLSVEEQLWEKEKEFLELGLQSKSLEYGQIYREVMKLFEKYLDLLGDEAFDIETFSELFDAGLSAISVAAVPPGYDSVIIGDVERTRLSGIKAVFLLGVNDGVIPKSGNGGGIISEYERRDLAEAGIELAPNIRQRAFIQRFYLYRNLTKPSHKLFVSYARSGADGKAINPSYLINNLKKLFPKMTEQSISNVYLEPCFLSKEVGLEYLVRRRNAIDADGLPMDWYALANALSDEDLEAYLNAPYCVYEHFPISKNVARALYGSELSGNISRLESFSSCAYKHFLAYGLCLKEREMAGLDALEIGNLYHKALERFGNTLSESEYDWFTVPDEARNQYAHQAFQDAILEVSHTEYLDNASDSFHIARMEEIFKRNVWVITTQIRKGKFVPEDYELKFSGKDEDSLLYSLSEGRVIQINGTIDRVDTLLADGKIYVKIVDYKTGSPKIDLNKIYHGLQLQLAVYLKAVLEKKNANGRDAIPAAAFYQYLDDPIIDEDETGQDIKDAYLVKLRPKGLVLDDTTAVIGMDESLAEPSTKSKVIPVATVRSHKPDSEFYEWWKSDTITKESTFSTIEDYAIAKVVSNGEAIFEGDVRINPFKDNSCTYCKFKGICRIDAKIPGYEMRKLSKMGYQQAVEKMETELALIKYKE